MKVTLYIAASVDGYISGQGGEIDWLSVVHQQGKDYGYYQFYDSVDALVIGSKTYELPDGKVEWPYPGKPSFVFIQQDMKTNRDDVTFVSDPVENVVGRSRSPGFQHIWLVGGGELIR